ncbi:GAF domain-like protein [Ascobolus immersus RN42]|uniref:GAF domain-like protein n=1 Tax=Ascobolus immersus RN42 TaxID=1160509 RepID=A0A3N4IIG0_ASCIM|nr:GAF domain-like protein [Ascobolus immersus RN42]
MPHADVTAIPEALTKAQTYEYLNEQVEALCFEQRNWVCNLANSASLLWHAFHSLPGKSQSVNWAGFYVLNPKAESELILGPFMGKVACQTIKFGRGVCGKAAADGKSVVVEDVDTFPGHIACDGDSKSEIVVPIVKDGKVLGVIDIDSTTASTFDEEDRKGLEKLATILADACDW